jgi:hypothetical protein
MSPGTTGTARAIGAWTAYRIKRASEAKTRALIRISGLPSESRWSWIRGVVGGAFYHDLDARRRGAHHCMLRASLP